MRISLTRRPVSSSRGSISYNGRGYYHHNSKPPRDPDYLKTVISPDGSLETWHNVWRHMSQHRNGFQDDSIKEKIGLKMRRSMQCYEYCHVMIRFNKYSFSYKEQLIQCTLKIMSAFIIKNTRENWSPVNSWLRPWPLSLKN